MAKYTTELRTICEVYAGCSEQQGLNKTSEVIAKALPKLFDFDFPIYDESYRTVLETKIVKHFYTREIGAETVGRWKLFLDERLNLIMPYYNQRYKSTLLEFNPMYDVDLTTDHGKENNGNSENSGTHNDNIENNRTYNRTDKYERNLGEKTDYTRNLATDQQGQDSQNNWEYFSDTPQGGITGLESGNYLTNATHNVNTDTNNSSGTETGTTNTALSQTGTDNRQLSDTDDTIRSDTGSTSGKANYTDTESYLEHVKGKTPGQSYSKLLTEYRKTFINIDNEIINELEPLFMQLW